MWGRRMLSESCRPALNLTNRTPSEKDSEGVTKLETDEEGRKKRKKKRKKRARGWVWWWEADWNESDNRVRTLQGRSRDKWGGRRGRKRKKKKPLFLCCHIINCSYWSLCGKFKTEAILSQWLVTRDASGECWWARHEESNPFRRRGACHWIPLRLHCVTRNIEQ